ncbi:MAG: hypothetical protein N3A72_10840 [bacterium]|nr:hypothetical protein [bacterium]
MNHLRKILLFIGIAVILGSTIAFAIESGKDTAKIITSSKSAKSVWRDSFFVDKKNLRPIGENPYFILKPGYKLSYQEGDIRITQTVLHETKVIDDVEVGVIENREEKNGKVFEVTKDYFAIDTITNDVYYFGEDVDVYKDGKIVGHDGAWVSGINGAKFGLMMPGKINVGDKYYQELAPKVAMDRAEIIETGLTIETPAGIFTNCIKVEETTPMEPKAKDYKWYAPGVGMIKDNDMILIKIEQPKNKEVNSR